MKTSAWINIILIITALAFVAGPVAVTAQNTPVEITMHAPSPKMARTTCGFKPWAAMVEKASGGKVKIKFAFGFTPGDPLENILKTTAPEISELNYGRTKPTAFPLTKAFALPGASIGIKDPVMASHIFWNLYKKFPEIQNEHKGLKVFYTYAMAPSSAATTTKPIRTLGDLNGMKITCGMENQALMNTLGAQWSDIGPQTCAASMEKGEVEGAIFGLMGQRAFGVTKQAKYFTEWPGGPFFSIVMSENQWNKLPPDIQKAIMSVSGDVGSKVISECDYKSNLKVKTGIQAEGKELITLSPEDQAKLDELYRPLREQRITAQENKGLPARAVYEDIRRMVKAYP